MKEKVVVFGGSGFLGSHIADELTLRGYEVVIFDLKDSKYLKENQKFVKGDILDFKKIKETVSGSDYIYNFAGLADLNKGMSEAIETVKQNILGNVHILEACKEFKVKRYIYASTVYVYSNTGGFYRCSKQAAEIYIESYQKYFNLDFTILRFGTVYGPRANGSNSIYRYLKQALKEDKITYYGNGEEIREYIHVRDAAKLSVDILSEEYENQHIMITGHYPMKVKDLLEMIKEILHKDLKIEYKKPQDGLGNDSHYKITPYIFHPKVAKKVVSHSYLELGQGLLDSITDIYENIK
ncbi:MAG: NAD(P)-dependent oxidoreductase [Armatimonadetes bacterium]|nr:NAD(P)-dependent oxidoreductase [Armatimonadota bacterium]